MAEVIGIAASIAQFIIIAAEVSNRLSDFCTTVQEAPRLFKNLKVQVPAIIEICEQFYQIQKSRTDDDSPELVDVLQECTRHTRELQGLLDNALPTANDSRATRAWKATRSITLEKRVEQLSQKLETFKTLLSLRLGLLTYAAVTDRGEDDDEGKSTTSFHFPTRRVGKFFGRETFLSRIDHALKPGGSEPRICVLVGMGGQGKTSIAFEYCRREMDRGYFGTIMWFDATSRATVRDRFTQIADELCEYNRRFANHPEAAIHHVKATLATWSAPWLFVFDSYDRIENFHDILKYLPEAPQGAVLITSRHSGAADLGTCVPVTGMDATDAVDLLVERARIQPTKGNLADAEEVVEMLGYLPLAIDQTAAYIRWRNISLKVFVQHYKKRKQLIMSFKPTLSDYRRLKDADPTGEPEPLSVWTTWEMSFSQIKTVESHLNLDCLCKFLSFLAFFNHLDIGMDMFQSYWEESSTPLEWMDMFVDPDNEEWDPYSYQDAVTLLEQLSLIQSQDHAAHKPVEHARDCWPWVSLHPLVRDWIQLRLLPAERQDCSVAALGVLSAYIQAGRKRGDWPLVARQGLLSHLDAVLQHQTQYFRDPEKANNDYLASCLRTVAEFYTDHGRYSEAEGTCQRVLAIEKSRSGDRSPNVISAEVQLSDVHFKQGRYKEVEASMLRYEELLDQSQPRQVDLGVEVKKTLARSYFKQGHYEEAIIRLRTALDAEMAKHGENYAGVLETKESLAQIYRNQGKHSEAIGLYEDVLRGYRSSGKPEDVKTWNCMVNLANDFRSQFQSASAAELYAHALGGMVANLGLDHPSTLSTKLFSAINHCAMKNYKAAEDIYHDVVARYHKVLGRKHPDTLKAIMNLAILLDRTGRLKEAEAMYQTALTGREEVLGLGNPYTLRTVERLVCVRWVLGKVEIAEALALRGLQAKPPKTVEQRFKFLSIEGGSSKAVEVPFEASELLLRQAISRDEAALDCSHPDVLGLVEVLKLVHEKQANSKSSS